MPRDNYEPDYSMQDQIDKLVRIAHAALTELEENEIIEALLLRDNEVRIWWEDHSKFNKRKGKR